VPFALPGVPPRMAHKDAGESSDEALRCILTFPNWEETIAGSTPAAAPRGGVPKEDGAAISGEYDLESLLVATPLSSANERDLENKSLTSSSERTSSESDAVDRPQAAGYAPVCSHVDALDLVCMSANSTALNHDTRLQSLARAPNSFEAFALPALPLPSDAHPCPKASSFAVAALDTHPQDLLLQIDFTVRISVQAFTDRVRRASATESDDKRVDDQDSAPTAADWLVLDATTNARVVGAHSLFARESQFLTKLDFIQMQALPSPSSLASSGSLPLPSAATAAPVIPTAPLVSQVPAPPVMLLRPVRFVHFLSSHDVQLQGRKPWNATGERDRKTGKWTIDESLIKPVMVKTKAASTTKTDAKQESERGKGID